jgi:Tol biopolymer transport system component
LETRSPHQVTQGRFDAQHPFWAPNGQLVYFISLAGEREALWSVGVAGGRPELVLEHVARAAIDAEGKRLALLRSEANVQWNTLWWSSPPGTEPTKEQRAPFDSLRANGAQLAFSRNGQLVVWTYGISPDLPDNASERIDFYIVPANGGLPSKVLTHVPKTANLSPFSWLPDNRHVILALPDLRLGNRHLWVADTASDNHWQITATHTNETDPAVSPDGRRIAYASDEVDFDLTFIAPDGRTRRPFLATARNEFAPTWAPSGDQFAFVTDRSGSLEIWARSRDGQFKRPIVSSSDFGVSQTQTMGALAFSPNGRTLAYQRSGDGNFHIWLSPATGGTPVRLTTMQGNRLFQDAPAWSPDSEWIAFTQAERGIRGQQVLRKLRVGTSESVSLIDNVAPFSQVEWTSDGRWIIYEATNGLMRVAADGGAPTVIADDTVFAFTVAADGRSLYALTESETFGHFALIQIDIMSGDVKVLNPDLGSVPVANQPIRGLSFAKGQGFLTSLASARSDIWLLEGFQQPRGWFGRLVDRLR